jgi:hypothetical protein
MKSATTLAAAVLAVGFGVVSYIMIALEPGMGFVTPADYFDPVKVTAGYASLPWLVSTLLYLTFPVALFVLAKASAQERVSQFGLTSAALGLLLGSIDLVGVQLSSLLSGKENLQAAVAALLPIRFAVLKATVVMLGLFAWGTTRESVGHSIGVRSWRALGWMVLGVSIVFLFVFVPAPIAFFVWAAGLTLTNARTREHGLKTPRAPEFSAQGIHSPSTASV